MRLFLPPLILIVLAFSPRSHKETFLAKSRQSCTQEKRRDCRLDLSPLTLFPFTAAERVIKALLQVLLSRAAKPQGYIVGGTVRSASANRSKMGDIKPLTITPLRFSSVSKSKTEMDLNWKKAGHTSINPSILHKSRSAWYMPDISHAGEGRKARSFSLATQRV